MCGGRDLAKAMGAKDKKPKADPMALQQEDAMKSINTQNRELVDQLRAQSQMIANDTAARQRELEAAKAPGQILVNANPYTVSLDLGTAGAGQEQTTAVTAPKKKPNQRLSLTADINLAGVGLNLGI
jgi:hypothetical protein